MLTNCMRHYPLSILTAIVIVGLSLFPIGPIELMEGVPLADKWTHMVMYGGLASVIWFEYWRRHDRVHWARVFQWAIVAPIAMSGVLELLQKYATNYRSGEWMDFVANTIGVSIGALLGLMLLRCFRKRI
ncbi:MAG: VanZ family protein [Bacteroidaceae bacterium]|nr:VanZ family protein [Bacteroidaceae bacterium]